MKLGEAKKLLDNFLNELRKDSPNNFKDSFDSAYKKYFKLSDGSFIFFFEGPYAGNLYHNPEAIIVRHDKAYEIYGAIAKVFLSLLKIPSEQLGNPVTGERWLGSGPGRYQLFDRGIIKWEGTSRVGGIEDIAHPVLFEHNPYEGIEVECIVAFVDIRGFTNWVLNNKSQKVQDLIFSIEKILQKHFAKRYFSELFIKGVGDGFMVVLEKDRYEHAVSELKKKGFQVSRGFVPDFITACYDCGNELIPMLKEKNLKIGFGVEIGKLKNVLVLGRWDYLGRTVNNASKYQNEASNSIIFSKKCFSKMNEIHELLKEIKNKIIIITSGKNKKQVRVKELKLKETIKGEGKGA